MRWSVRIEAGAHLRKSAAQRTWRPIARQALRPDIVLSRQALRLYGMGLAASRRDGWSGLIGRTVALRLAIECGALVDELVDAGVWIENDLSYAIRVARDDPDLGRAVFRPSRRRRLRTLRGGR